jgi:thiamine biosynthesis lipoprotein
MGTQARIVVYAPDAAAASRASDAAFARIRELDEIMTDYRPTSELMLLCRQAGQGSQKISDDLYGVLSRAQEIARRTGGAFDVTVGPVVRLWREARRRKTLPDPERLASARDLVGFDKLRLDSGQQTAWLLRPGMLLDLGGIAKGYAADQALAVLKSHGIRSALVAIGGDIAVSSPPPDRKGWKIAIAPLDSSDQEPTRLLLLHDRGVSTSGDREQFVEIGGKRYSHIVNPRTGIGLEGRSSVTVVAPDATTSDSFATALSVLDPAQGLKLVKSTPRLGALIVQQDEYGRREFRAGFMPLQDAGDH